MSEPTPSDPDDDSTLDEWILFETANKHGVADEDIVHAIDHHVRTWKQDDGVTVYIGPSRSGAMLEVGHVEWYGIDAINHAMPARDKYL